MKRLLTTLVFALACYGLAVAQRTVTGTVSGDGESLIGASVTVKGASGGARTDINGKYSIKVPAGATTLTFSYTGFATQDVTLGSSDVLDVTLSSNSQLNEVVVTALGIKRDKKALGYASTVVSAAEINERPETDVARALIGRSPGVQITNSSGLAGSGTKINIRGISTISGNAQPLWIVDGVPVNTAANENNNFNDGNITPTRNLDIDPNNIESISILRGLSATTLYGSQGRNGVILVTTKTGSSAKKRYRTTVSQTYNLIDAIVPEYQNKWGNGFDGDYGEFFSNWGYVFDGKVPPNNPRHPYYEHRNLFPEVPEFQQANGYIPQAIPNNIKDFFQRGTSLTTSVNTGVSGDFGSFNVAFNRTSEEGYIANNSLGRTNISIGGTANLSEKLTFNANFNYVRTDFKTPTVGAGLGSNSNGGPSVFANLFYVPRNIDLMNWPYQNPVTGGAVYYRNGGDITNPRWLLENSSQQSLTNRFFSSMGLNYALTDWLKLGYNLGIDTYSEGQQYHVNRGASGFPTAVAAFGTGLLRNTNAVNTIYDHTIRLNAARNITDDLDFTANIGVNARQDTYDQNGVESTNQVVFGLLEHRNFVTHDTRTLRNGQLNFYSRRIWLGAFADATLGYKNYLYLNLQARNDWASTHEKDYRSLLYPGVSVSFIPTQAFAGLESKTLNFLKLRLGYGTSANFADPYSTRPYLSLVSGLTVDAVGTVNALALSSLLANPDLRPELQQELEAGVEARLFNNRVGIDLSLYDRTAKDQIVNRPLDPSTGFGSTFVNAGTISNKGIELGFSVTPVQTSDFTWNLRANFTKNISNVEELPDGSEEIYIAGFSSLGNFAIEGQPFGVIKGIATVKDENGNAVITSNGDYKQTSEIQIIGDPNPDFLLTGLTDINWKGFTLSGQVDYVHGGDIYSFSAGALIGRGVAKELEDFDPTLTVILPGVLEDGTPNNIQMPASGVFFGNTIIGGGPDDKGIFDGTRLRLREVSLAYNLPKSILGSAPIQGVSISLVANNMWFRAFNTPASSKVDADRTAFGTGNGLGFDFLGGPSTRRYGATIKVSF